MAGLDHFFNLLVLAVITASSCDDDGGTLASREGVSILPCPNPQDILPCVCSGEDQYSMDMDCSQVENEDQLARVFSANFPLTQFRQLNIKSNTNLKIIRKGDLGVVSFQQIQFTDGVLEEVQEEALSHSYSSLTYIHIYQNELSKFPFSELSLFTSLAYLNLFGNKFDQFPVMESNSLTEIELAVNLISEIPVGGFRNLPNIEAIDIHGNHIKYIYPGEIILYVPMLLIANIERLNKFIATILTRSETMIRKRLNVI